MSSFLKFQHLYYLFFFYLWTLLVLCAYIGGALLARCPISLGDAADAYARNLFTFLFRENIELKMFVLNQFGGRSRAPKPSLSR